MLRPQDHDCYDLSDALLTFDQEQQDLAKAARVRVLGLSTGPHRSTGK